MNYQDNETAVVIEKEIECLNSYEKIDQFIGCVIFITYIDAKTLIVQIVNSF